MSRFFTITCSLGVGFLLGHFLYQPATVSVLTWVALVVNVMGIFGNAAFLREVKP